MLDLYGSSFLESGIGCKSIKYFDVVDGKPGHNWNFQACSTDITGLIATRNSIKRGLELCLKAKNERSTSILAETITTFIGRFNSIEKSMKSLNNRIGSLECANQNFATHFNSEEIFKSRKQEQL